MSVKRAATTDLNHENWDKEDPSENEKMGVFKQAPRDVLEKRVIRTAKRRSAQPYNNAEKPKSAFSGFSGFNKPPPASFDFLANLTNGQNNFKNDATVSSSFVSSTPLPKTSITPSTLSNLFNSNNDTPKIPSNIFNVTSSSIFKPPTSNMFMPPLSSSENKFNNISNIAKPPSNVSSSTISKPESIFTTQIADSTINNSVFKLPAKTTQNDTPFVTNNLKPIPTLTQSTSLFGVPNSFSKNISPNEPEKSTPKPQNEVFQSASKNDLIENKDNEDENFQMFYSSVKKLNQDFLDWISIHLKKNPTCVLTPTFKSYNEYLIELRDTYNKRNNNNNDPKSLNKATEKSEVNTKSDNIFNPGVTGKQRSIFDTQSTKETDSMKPESQFKFSNTTATTSSSTIPSGTFSFSNKNTSEDKKSITQSSSIFSFKDKSESVKNPSETLKSESSKMFLKENPTVMTTTNTFMTNKLTTAGNKPLDGSFTVKNIPPTSNSMFSFGNKTVTPASSTNTNSETPPSFGFGVKNTATTASSTFSFMNKASTIGNKDDTTTTTAFSFGNKITANENKSDNLTATSSIFKNTSSPLSSDKVSSTSVNKNTPLFGFTSEAASPPNPKPLFSFSSETSTEKNTALTAESNLSFKPPVFSFGNKNNTQPTNTPSENKPVNSLEATSNKTPFSFTANNNFLTPNKSGEIKVDATLNNTPFGSPNTFSFAKSPTSQPTATSTSLFGSNSTPFSFGTPKPFSFSPKVENTPSAENVEGEENEEPPKVEYTPVVEEGCVFEKKCKIFTKKDKSYVDMGVGTLFIKKVGEGEKHQLLVRANTNIGTVLMNFILSKDIPCQRMGKNNVMVVCIPTPQSQPPPTPMLIRVKSGEEADELLEQLKKYQS